VGTDISGAIESRPICSYPPQYASGKGWEFAMSLDQIHDARDYDSFGCLFGVTNFAGFEPVAAERGLPGDVAPGQCPLGRLVLPLTDAT
jgi:hypothetical protein